MPEDSAISIGNDSAKDDAIVSKPQFAAAAKTPATNILRRFYPPKYVVSSSVEKANPLKANKATTPRQPRRSKAS